MLKISQTIVVEGKYDKIKLSSLVDANILVTHGFRIFRDAALLKLIRSYAKTTGVIILTDADAAGFQIRNFLKGAIREGRVYHVYTPDIYGKERRKERASAEGKLGVEGIEKSKLLECFQKAGIPFEDAPSEVTPQKSITKYDLYAWGLVGAPNSHEKRRRLLQKLELPERLSAKEMLDVLHTQVSSEQLETALESLQGEQEARWEQ